MFFISIMALGYYYNVTFIQLGLLDLEERLIGLDRQSVVLYMALLARFLPWLRDLVPLVSGVIGFRAVLLSLTDDP